MYATILMATDTLVTRTHDGFGLTGHGWEILIIAFIIWLVS